MTRLRPFLSAGESPRPFGEVLAERRDCDPRRGTLEQIARIEAEAAEAADAAERKRLQCAAEALRCALDETRAPRRA